MILFRSIWPLLFLTGLWVAAVYLIRYVLRRLLDHK